MLARSCLTYVQEGVEEGEREVDFVVHSLAAVGTSSHSFSLMLYVQPPSLGSNSGEGVYYVHTVTLACSTVASPYSFLRQAATQVKECNVYAH